MRSKLRHPVRAIREPFGTAGLIVACVALIAALGGSAIAAKGALTAKQKKEVTKIAKQYAGKPGAPGATGPAGPQGNPGAAGAKGADGTNGTNGTNGVSPAGTEFTGTKSGHCTEGGVEFKGVNTTYACNGAKGANGGTAEVMAPGQTVRGAWSLGQTPETSTQNTTSISFGLKYPGEEPPTVVYVKAPGEETDKCPGSAAEPEAVPGVVCIYQAFASQEEDKFDFFAAGTELFGTTLSGVSLFFNMHTRPNPDQARTFAVLVTGTWAVTAPTA